MYGLDVGNQNANGTDRRVRKTRRALFDALMALLTQGTYESITVQDVIDKADVSRSTFYAHFTDKDHLLTEAFRDLRSRFRAEVPEYPGEHEPFGWSRREFEWHLRMVRDLCDGNGSKCPIGGLHECALLHRELERELTEVVRNDLARMAEISVDRVPAEVTQFVTHGFMSLLRSWLEDPAGRSVAEIDRLFHALALPGATAALGIDARAAPQRSAAGSLSTT